MPRFISWNVNGIRACLKKGFIESMSALSADFICLQETKCQAETLPDFSNFGYEYSYFNYAEKKGYSGTAIFAREAPQSVSYHIPNHANEGRVVTLKYPAYYLVNAYVPNSGDALKRLEYRTRSWEPDMRAYLGELAQELPVVYCGDLNVAHKEIDLTHPQSNHYSAGFTDEERSELTLLLESGFVDTFRHLYPSVGGAYTWWSYRSMARERNIGWRIDYFVISKELLPNLKEATIYPDIYGSDHCPVGIFLDF